MKLLVFSTPNIESLFLSRARDLHLLRTRFKFHSDYYYPDQSRNKGEASGALAPGTVYVGAQN
jgi:hypothetical protein